MLLLDPLFASMSLLSSSPLINNGIFISGEDDVLFVIGEVEECLGDGAGV